MHHKNSISTFNIISEETTRSQEYSTESHLKKLSASIEINMFDQGNLFELMPVKGRSKTNSHHQVMTLRK